MLHTEAPWAGNITAARRQRIEMKRVLDFVVAALGIFMLSPMLVVIAVAIVLFSGRPVFFTQVRVGRGGNEFRLLKFRSMEVRPHSAAGSFDAGNSAHVTPVGRMLRRTKLDEVPQLWNVLRGEMSLVGPRPEVRSWVNAFPDRWARIHTVRPGITDPASIEYRNEEELLASSSNPEQMYRNDILPRKLELYEAYVQEQSLLGDIAILIKTIAVVAGWRTNR